MEEGTWLALRKLCIGLGGLKSKDLDAELSSGGEGHSVDARTGDALAVSPGGDLASIVHGALVRALSCRKPDAEVMSQGTCREERCRDWSNACVSRGLLGVLARGLFLLRSPSSTPSPSASAVLPASFSPSPPVQGSPFPEASGA